MDVESFIYSHCKEVLYVSVAQCYSHISVNFSHDRLCVGSPHLVLAAFAPCNILNASSVAFYTFMCMWNSCPSDGQCITMFLSVSYSSLISCPNYTVHILIDPVNAVLE